MFYPSKFEQHGSHPIFNAQQNLRERTHYVDDDTLRFHKSRIVSTKITDDGLLFAMVESVAHWDNMKRGFRPVIFDIFGTVLESTSLEDCHKTKAQATKAMWAKLDSIDAQSHTVEALAQFRYRLTYSLDELHASIKGKGAA